MMTFFEEDGYLNIDELIIEQPSFLKMIDDGVVTEDELQDQSRRVVACLRSFEATATEEQIDCVRELLAEVSVLVAARHLYEEQM